MNLETWEFLALSGVLLIGFEIFMPTFYLLPIGLAFLVTAMSATLTESWIILLLVFSVSSLISFFAFSKFRVKKSDSVATNADGMVGSEVEVIKELVNGRGGQVKLYGDTWMASSSKGLDFSEGDRAVIVKVDGNNVEIDRIN